MALPVLDLGGLSWLRDHPDTAAPGDAAARRPRPAPTKDESAGTPVPEKHDLQQMSVPAPSGDRQNDPLAAWLSTEPDSEHVAGASTAPATCKAVTKAKKPCPNRPNASGLCHVHDPDRLCGAPTGKNGHGRCHATTGSGPCRRHTATTTAPTCPRCSQPMTLQPWSVLDQPAGTRIAVCTGCQNALLTT
ncbi:hypothetical protein [Streptomyces sp. BH055]|uniref:hypothetical protein n=1 Tax=Streptomyces sp. BH055 TaxID=3401173 RepID=UPI003BB4E41F